MNTVTQEPEVTAAEMDLASVHVRFNVGPKKTAGLPSKEGIGSSTGTGGSMVWQEPGSLVDITTLRYLLANEGFVLVTGYYQEEWRNPAPAGKEQKDLRTNWIAHFHFVPVDEAVLSDHVEVVRSAFDDLCQEFFWQVKPFHNLGDRGPWLSIACNERRPICDDEGNPVQVNVKLDGRKTGETRDLTASATFSFNDGSPVLHLVPST